MDVESTSFSRKNSEVASHMLQRRSSAQPAVSSARAAGGSGSAGGSNAAFPAASGSPRQRSATKAEKRRREALVARVRKLRAFAETAHIDVGGDLVADIAETLPSSAELRFCQQAADSAQLVTVTASHVVVHHIGTEEGAPIVVELAVAIEDIVAICDSAQDPEVAYVHAAHEGHLSQRDHEHRLLFFPSRSAKETFIAHVFALMLARRTGGVGSVTASVEELLESVDEGAELGLVTWDGPLRSVADVRRNLSELQSALTGASAAGGDAGRGGSALLEGTEHDYANAAGNEAFCERLADIAMGEHDRKVHFSCEASVQSNTHDVVVMTNTALYITKARNFALIRHRIPFSAIEGVAVDTTDAELVLVQFDFAQVKLRGDVLLRMQSRFRDAFIKILVKVYEEVVVDRLRVVHQDDVFWAKRGFVESQLLRVVQTFKAKRSEDLSDEQREACQWLVWIVTHRLADLVACLAASRLEAEQLDFIGRCLVTLCEHCGCIEALIRHCLEAELDAAGSTAILQGANFTASVVLHYLSSQGDQYVAVVLSSVLEEFVNDANTTYAFRPEQLMFWAGEFLNAIFGARNGDLMPEELRIVIALIADVCAASPPTSSAPTPAAPRRPRDPYPIIGNLVFNRYFCPAIRSPASHGVVVGTIDDTRRANLTEVARLMLDIATFRAPASSQEPLEAFARSKLSVMTGFLKDLVFADVLSRTASAPARAVVGSVAAAESEARRIDLRRHNMKLLLVMNRVLGAHVGRFLVAAWCSVCAAPTASPSASASAPPPRDQHQAQVLSTPPPAGAAAAPQAVVVEQSTRGVAHPPTRPPQLDSDDERDQLDAEAMLLRERVAMLERELSRTKVIAARTAEAYGEVKQALAEALAANTQLQRNLDEAQRTGGGSGESDGAGFPGANSRFGTSLLAGGLLPPAPDAPFGGPERPFGCPLDTYVLPPVVRPSHR